MVGDLLPCHGGGGKIHHEVHLIRNWGMGALHLPRDLYKDVLDIGVALLQPSLAYDSCHLGNSYLQPYLGFGQMGHSSWRRGIVICALLAVLWQKKTWVSMAITPVQ